VSTEDFVMQVLMGELEMDPQSSTILAYDAAEPGSQGTVIREDYESDERYDARSSTLRMLFP